MAIHLQLVSNENLIRHMEVNTQVEVGRRDYWEPEAGGPGRFIIAETERTNVSRCWFVVHAIDGSRVRIDNVHKTHPVTIAEPQCVIPPGGSKAVSLTDTMVIRLYESVRLLVSKNQVNPQLAIHGPNDHGLEISMIRSFRAEVEKPLGSDESAGALLVRPIFDRRGEMGPMEVIRLVRKVLAVLIEAAGSDAFLEQAVRTTAEISGLDRALLLVPSTVHRENSPTDNATDLSDGSLFGSMMQVFPVEKTKAMPLETLADEPLIGKQNLSSGRELVWETRAQFVSEIARQANKPPISHSVLARVVDLLTTQIYESTSDPISQSLGSLKSVIAAPVLDRRGRLTAVLYGDRWQLRDGKENQITEFEGLLVEVLASSVAAGAARQAEETLRANLSEFFSPRVASMLAKKPEMLTGRDAEVTVLFCDLRGFSSISEIHGTKRSIELINEVLTELSHCVVNKDGVLVDYVGDELLAMWGAPEAQPDHPQRAVDCAQTMLTAARLLSNRWSEAFGIKIDVGIGVNSGSAQVGNVGSQLKFKYGVLGHTVNLASRIQSASKQFGVRCLLPEQTVRCLSNRDCLRRIGIIRVAGIGQEVEVYEFVEQPTKEWTYLKEQYEHSLDDYLSFDPCKSIERLTKLALRYDDDQATKYLLRRAEQMQSTPRDEQAVVWELTSK